MSILLQNILIGSLILSAVIYVVWHLTRSRRPGDACGGCKQSCRSNDCPHLVRATNDCPTDAAKARQHS